MGGYDSDGLHWEDGDLTFEQRAALVRLDPDLAPVPVVEEQPPPPEQAGLRKLAYGLAWLLAAAILAATVALKLIEVRV